MAAILAVEGLASDEDCLLYTSKNACSVAQTLEEAAADVVGHPVHMTGCGRTDAGVHARTYVANFRTESRIPVDRVAYALNTHLPADIVVTGAREVPLGFNAIGSCVRKEYTYQIYKMCIRDRGDVLVQFWIFKITREGLVNAGFLVLRIVMLVTGTFLLTRCV